MPLIPFSIIYCAPPQHFVSWMTTFILLTNLPFGPGSAGTSGLCSTWQQREWHKGWGLSHLKATYSSIWWLRLAIGWDFSWGPGWTHCMWLLGLLIIQWLVLKMSIPRRGLGKFVSPFIMFLRSHVASLLLSHRPTQIHGEGVISYLLMGKWQYHIVRTCEMGSLGATTFGK